MPVPVEEAPVGRRFSKTEREHRLKVVAELDAKGWNQYAISDELDRLGMGVSQVQVSSDLKNIRQRYIKSQMTCQEDVKARALQRLDWVAQKATKSFEQSEGKFLEEIIRQVLEQKDEAEEAGKQLTEFRITVKSLPANEFLQTFRQVVLNQCGIMGVKTDANGKEPASVSVNVGVQVNVWDQLAGIASQPVVDRVEQRIQQRLEGTADGQDGERSETVLSPEVRTEGEVAEAE